MNLAGDLRRGRRVIDEDRARTPCRQRAFSPNTTARTSSSLPTHIRTRSAPATAAAGVGALVPPCFSRPSGRPSPGCGCRRSLGARPARDARPSEIPSRQVREMPFSSFPSGSSLHRLQGCVHVTPVSVERGPRRGDRRPHLGRRRAARVVAACDRALERQHHAGVGIDLARKGLQLGERQVGERLAALLRRGAPRGRRLRARRETARLCGPDSRRGRSPSRVLRAPPRACAPHRP